VRTKKSAISLILAATYLLAIPQFLPAADAPPPVSQPSVTVINSAVVRGILGRTVQDANGKDMGRIVDIIVDPAGQVRAAIIDFGGFLGVGIRKIAVNWSALRFGGAVKRGDDIRLELTREQLKTAPQYREGERVVVVGSTGALEPLNYPPLSTPEK
jgi:PRC-barrel domain